jgi:hypothetical protein
VGNIFLFVLNVFPSSSQDFPTASHALAKLELPYIHKLQKREGREGKGRTVGKGKHKGASIGECSMFREDLCWVPKLLVTIFGQG